MSEDSTKNHRSSATHQGPQHSATLDRRNLKRPQNMMKKESTKTAEAVAISSFAKCQAENLRRRQELAEKINQERLAQMRKKRMQQRVSIQPMENVEKTPEIVEKVVDKPVEKYVENPMQTSVNAKLAKTWGVMPRPRQSAQQLKNEAIQKAMRAMATMESQEKKQKRPVRRMTMNHKKRVVMAVFCALAVVAGIGYFVGTNLPDVSVRVTALQSGIENPYPSYIPRGYSLTTSMAGDNHVSMTFSNGEKTFALSEEKSAWDSKTLLNNYVELNWRSYDMIKEQGLTIYISGSNAAWVNGGVRYIIEAEPDTLTNKQIKNIATSL